MQDMFAMFVASKRNGVTIGFLSHRLGVVKFSPPVTYVYHISRYFRESHLVAPFFLRGLGATSGPCKQRPNSGLRQISTQNPVRATLAERKGAVLKCYTRSFLKHGITLDIFSPQLPVADWLEYWTPSQVYVPILISSLRRCSQVFPQKTHEIVHPPTGKKKLMILRKPLKNQNFADPTKMPMLWYLTFQKCNPGRVLEAFLHGFHKSICAFKIYYIFAHLEERRRKKKTPHGEHSEIPHRLNPCWKNLNQGLWGGPASICTIKTPRELWFFEPSQHGHLGLVEVGCCFLHTKLVAWWSACYGSSWAWCLWGNSLWNISSQHGQCIPWDLVSRS